MPMPNDLTEAIRDELKRHTATWPWIHDNSRTPGYGPGRPHRGIRCTCGEFEMEPKPPANRPWREWEQHRAEAVTDAVYAYQRSDYDGG